MLLAGIPANSIRSLQELSNAYHRYIYAHTLPFNGTGRIRWCIYLALWIERARAISLFSPLLLLDFFLAGDGATGREEGCSGFE